MSKTGMKNLHPRLATAIAGWSQWAAEQPEVIRMLEGGLTNESWLLQSGADHYVLRLNADNSNALGIDRRQESAAMTEAASAGLAPQVIHNDPAAGILVREFLPGNSWQQREFHAIDNIHRLVKLLKSIHRLTATGQILDFAQRASHYWQHINLSASHVQQLKKLEQKVIYRMDEARLLNHAPCLCHNDLLGSNLITTSNKALKAIDWEYAAIGDPFFDLAVIIEGNRMEEGSARLFVASYAGYDDEATCRAMAIGEALHRLDLCRVIYCYIDLLWHAVQHNRQPTRKMQAAIEGKLLNLQQRLQHT